MTSATEILQQYWGYTSFRPQQQDIINAVLEGKDVLALLPTGGGKSVCFQVPALMKDGLCLVVSPLIALMKDQVEQLEKRGISAVALHSGLNFFEVQQALQNAVDGAYKFLYLSPERLQANTFKEFLPHLDINLIAVDEAHCISQWGYDFRPPYLKIAELKESVPGIPMLALTASATPKVQDDIIDKLLLKDVEVFRQSFEKPNLSYSVFKVDSKINKVIDILRNVAGSSIIYCRNRRVTKEVAHLLSLQGVSAEFYHAGLEQKQRSAKQDAWKQNITRVIACTNAFGMGIDKPDVRTVIHYDVPDCIENYYQEAGRAGRDGKKAYAVLLYQEEDLHTLEALPDQRFPAIYEIKKVYQHLADFLQIPVGSGEACYFDFDLNEFVRNFRLDVHVVMNVLRVLEQEGHISFNESIFLPSHVMFRAPKELLDDFSMSHPELDVVMKCLLRTYTGIYDNRVSVFEKQVARLTRKDVTAVQKDLHNLHALGVIEYLPQKETPQIYFISGRAPADFLYINHEQYLLRKKEYTAKTEAVIKYLKEDKICRSKYISAYFGETVLNDCGICDVCLQKKKREFSKEEFELVKRQLEKLVGENVNNTKELVQKITGIKKEKVWQVLQFLQSENKVSIDAFGQISLH